MNRSKLWLGSLPLSSANKLLPLKISSRWAITWAMMLLIGSASKTSATDLVRLDGTWWSALTDAQQIIATQGMLGAYEEGYNNGYLSAANKDQVDFHSTRSDSQLLNDPDSNVHYPKTFGTYEQEITDFYSLHPSSMDVLVGNVLACLSENPQFSCDQVSKYHSQ